MCTDSVIFSNTLQQLVENFICLYVFVKLYYYEAYYYYYYLNIGAVIISNQSLFKIYHINHAKDKRVYILENVEKTPTQA